MTEAESGDDKPDAELQSMTDAERPSKSQLKREANDILELASRLGETSESSLAALPLAENIRDAVWQLKKSPPTVHVSGNYISSQKYCERTVTMLWQ